MRKIVAVGAAASALLLAGCAGGATIKATVGTGSALCNDMSTFTSEAAALTDAAKETRATLLQELPPIHAILSKMAAEAPSVDTINGKPLKGDLTTVGGIYASLISALQNTTPTDPAAVTNALAAVNAKQGQTLTDAVNRLDAYAGSVCKVSTSSPSVATTTSTAAPSATTAAPVGPVAPATSTSAP